MSRGRAHGILSLLALVLSHPAGAEVLAPHAAEYQLSRNGLPFADMVMTFKTEGDDYRYQARVTPRPALALLNLAVTSATADVTEESDGTRAGERLRPDHYRFRRGDTRDRELTIAFDWARHRALTTSEERPWSMTVPDGTLDKLVVLLALRQDLAAGTSDATYRVADGGRLKSYRYRRTGNARITTPEGVWECIQVARSKNDAPADYRLWLAPTLDFLPVLIEREENGAVFRMELQRHTPEAG